MCGLTGGWSHQRFNELQDALPHMTASLVHRGPDDEPPHHGQGFFRPHAGR